eukprot:3143004-Pleurochrysis_carterae.AAC.1
MRSSPQRWEAQAAAVEMSRMRAEKARLQAQMESLLQAVGASNSRGAHDRSDASIAGDSDGA